jgi:hypothetical protein
MTVKTAVELKQKAFYEVSVFWRHPSQLEIQHSTDWFATRGSEANFINKKLIILTHNAHRQGWFITTDTRMPRVYVTCLMKQQRSSERVAQNPSESYLWSKLTCDHLATKQPWQNLLLKYISTDCERALALDKRYNSEASTDFISLASMANCA